MDVEEYRIRGKEMVDYIADYLTTVKDRKVFPDKKPGFLHELLPESAPVEGESWKQIFRDVENVIMPGVTHWQSPHMHAYYPNLSSYPSLLGDMLAEGINSLCFTWASSPAGTELETIVMNWLGKMIGLPNDFLHNRKDSTGGGVIQTTTSEATLVCLLAGRTQAIKQYHKIYPEMEDAEINARLVAYCSDQAHSSLEKAAIIAMVKMRYIESDENASMRGDRLLDAIKKDRENGLIPFWVCNTLGTTGACAFDNLEEVGEVCRNEDLWLHVDAAYAGNSFVCPEYRVWLKGVEYADSFVLNAAKWLLVTFDCAPMWVKNCSVIHNAFNVNPIYLKHENSGSAIDYMHWQIGLSKKFRALKLWFVIRNFGITGLQKHIRQGVRFAQKFEALVLADPRFEIPAARHLGLVVFRLNGENELTELLLKRLNSRGKIHCIPSYLKNKYIIRFTVTSQYTTNEDILQDWKEIKTVATEVLNEYEQKVILPSKVKVPLKETKEINESFGASLLLSNSPMSPKIVNGSFAALYDQGDVMEEYSKVFSKLRLGAPNSPYMRRRIKGILMSGKQYSLDSHLDLFQGVEQNSSRRPNSEPENLKNKPLMEDTNEEESSSSTEGSVKMDHLEIPHPTGKHQRSKSVDHQIPIIISNVDTVLQKCVKCGHDINQ